MNARALKAPGLGFVAVKPDPEPEPLRSDIAAFVGQTRRGPVGVPTRVVGWRGYREVFGELDVALDMPYAVRGYFENGGEVAWITRLTAPNPTISKATWKPTDLWDPVRKAGVPAAEYEVRAASTGAWSQKARVTFTYRGRTVAGPPTVDVTVRTSDETEDLRAIPALRISETVAEMSRLIRLEATVARTAPGPAPRAFAVETVVLDDKGSAGKPELEDYLNAIEQLDDVPEVAIIALPDLHICLGDIAATKVLREAAARAETLRDRMVLVDLPPREHWHVDDILTWIRETLGRGDTDLTGETRWWRAAALYHPWVRVSDPLGGPARPVRDIAPSGHVAGVISKLDRERGAHSTPANSPALDMLDLYEEYGDDEHAQLNVEGVDLLRCVPSLGFSVWGGRTLDRSEGNPFVAHRRLIHRLVRAIRRVAQPLVFETNGPQLWFAFVRAITAVLLEAWRAGALAGGRPDEAFDVTCDETTNPPEEIDNGRCVCSIEVAPAIPMEFILIRVALSRDGTLEVLQ